MKYEITFSCGHTETIELYGPTKERERKIAYFESKGECSECYKARKNAERAAKVEQLNSKLDTYDLPELVGSPKQVAWAMDIRREAYNDLAMDGHKKAFASISDESSAKFWIDNRDSLSSIAINRHKSSVAKTLTKSDIFKAAHRAARFLKAQYPDTDYHANFAIALKDLYSMVKSAKAAA